MTVLQPVRYLVSLKDVEPSTVYKTTQWWPRKRGTRHWAIDQSISLSLFDSAPKRWLHKQPT